MESQCDYFMYFPAVPFPAREVLLGEPGRYRALPRRNHLYLGETVRFLLVLRCRSGVGGAPRPPWGELAGSLSALASVSPAGGGGGGGAGDEALPGEAEEEEGAAGAGEATAGGSVFRECRALLTHGQGAPGTTAVAVPPEEPIVSTDEVIFPLTISLDRLPPSTLKAKIVATVWRRDQERGEVRERGYLSILQDRAPSQTFREEQGAFKAQVSTMLTVLPPPELKCQQLNVSGKHLTVLKVLNAASQDELSVWDVRILPNFNASYLPMMPDGSVLLVDDICHQSGEVSMASFCQVPSATSAWPCSLRALEEQNFLFQLQAPEQPPDSTKEAAEHPSCPSQVCDDCRMRVTSCLASALCSHVHSHQQPAGLSGSALGVDTRKCCCREETGLWRMPCHARHSRLNCVPHPSQQPGILPQRQRPHFLRHIPGPTCWLVRVVSAHETETPVHCKRFQSTPRGPASLPQKQPREPSSPGAGGASSSQPWALPELLTPTASTGTPPEVRKCHGAPGHHSPRRLSSGPPPLLAPRQGCSFP
ncbi:trafficking protein particle complex subunit 14 isoform X2 [Candoia aspera]|uniref:trafficking protein particle complex subunit 14 isoform X2 n=1 Tax=Candoia aspera TaxID=51853 RepID=UPI002FD83BC4